MLFPDICLTLGGITTGIQIRRHVIIYRISIGLPLGTSNTDTWRLKPSTRCQLLVDRSELCTKCIFNFFSTCSRSVRAKKKTSSCQPNLIVYQCYFMLFSKFLNSFSKRPREKKEERRKKRKKKGNKFVPTFRNHLGSGLGGGASVWGARLQNLSRMCACQLSLSPAQAGK